MRGLVAMVALALASSWAAEARAACESARTDETTASLPSRWRAAVEELLRSSSEPGHPWSCSGGTVVLEPTPSGAFLRIARAGEPAITRAVRAPEDVVPLGEALLSAPLESAPPESPQPTNRPPAPTPEPTPRVEQTLLAPVTAHEAPLAPSNVAPPPTKQPRIFLGAGVDGRAVGRSDVAWMGPTLNAGVPVGRWLPSLSLRYQSSTGSDGPPLEEISAALAVQARIPLRAYELRLGPTMRGAGVFRDLPRPRGEQSEMQARVGVVTSLVIPLPRWVNVVIGVDADVVFLSRQMATTSEADSAALIPFPAFTVGGTLGIELPL